MVICMPFTLLKLDPLSFSFFVLHKAVSIIHWQEIVT